MEQIKILIVDDNEEYVMSLVMKFIESLDERADITIITNREYLSVYLSELHDIGILIVNENLYDNSFDKLIFNDVYILTENDISNEEQRNYVYKYSSLDHIYTKIASLSRLDKVNVVTSHKSKKIVVYSPVGGSGKTYTTLGIARALALLNMKVLYLNVESVQNFNFYLDNKSFVNKEFEQALVRQTEDLLERFRSNLHTQEFDYLPPFQQSMITLNISANLYEQLIQQIEDLKIYDFIIIEIPTEFTQDNVMFMGMSDKTLIVTKQDEFSTYKLERFLTNIDYIGQDKFKVICNNYEESKENYLIMSTREKKYEILEYINKEDSLYEDTVGTHMDDGFQKIAYYLV